MPQGRAFSGIMTRADLNNCVAFRRKHGMDLDLMQFKPCTVDPGGDRACAPPPWVRRQWRRQRPCFVVCVFTRRYSCVVRSSLIISRMDYVSVSPFSLL